ncbi:hypothetical protein Q3G72_009699 [Acer saccharum]|nr:hypothetical protein Q3G72_009699 [Acer saccharum]
MLTENHNTRDFSPNYSLSLSLSRLTVRVSHSPLLNSSQRRRRPFLSPFVGCIISVVAFVAATTPLPHPLFSAALDFAGFYVNIKGVAGIERGGPG